MIYSSVRMSYLVPNDKCHGSLEGLFHLRLPIVHMAGLLDMFRGSKSIDWASDIAVL